MSDVHLSREVADGLLDDLSRCAREADPMLSTLTRAAVADMLDALRERTAEAFATPPGDPFRRARAEGVREGFALAEEHAELEMALEPEDVRIDLAEAARLRDRLLDNLGGAQSGPGMVLARPVYHLRAQDLIAGMVRVYGLTEVGARHFTLGAPDATDGHSWEASALPGLTREKPLTGESFGPGRDVDLDEVLSDLTDRGELPAGGGDYLVRWTY